MINKVMVKAWKVESFMYALVGYGIDLDTLDMEESKDMQRFRWKRNGVEIATYDERKQHGFVLSSAIKPLNHMVCGNILKFPY